MPGDILVIQNDPFGDSDATILGQLNTGDPATLVDFVRWAQAHYPFSVIYGLLVNPYPYLGADRMIELSILNEKGDRRGVGITGPQLNALRQVSCIESAAASVASSGCRLVGRDQQSALT